MEVFRGFWYKQGNTDKKTDKNTNNNQDVYIQYHNYSEDTTSSNDKLFLYPDDNVNNNNNTGYILTEMNWHMKKPEINEYVEFFQELLYETYNNIPLGKWTGIDFLLKIIGIDTNIKTNGSGMSTITIPKVFYNYEKCIYMGDNTFLVKRMLDTSCYDFLQASILNYLSENVHEKKIRDIFNEMNTFSWSEEFYYPDSNLCENTKEFKYSDNSNPFNDNSIIDKTVSLSDWVIYCQKTSRVYKSFTDKIKNSIFKPDNLHHYLKIRDIPFILVLYLCGMDEKFDELYKIESDNLENTDKITYKVDDWVCMPSIAWLLFS